MVKTQVKKTIEEKGLIKKGDNVLVCVSGGPDSMVLLHIMASLKKEYGIELVVAHLDHMIRGGRSRADAKFVEKEATKLNIPFIAEKSDVKTIAASNRMSIEEAARLARYDFYRRAAEKVGAKKIATGHTMDDQAETVLMRLIKGSGSLGLSGIPYKRGLGNTHIIRPMLDVKREDVEKYIKRHKIPSRLDITNLKTIYFRNKIRRVLITLLEKEFNPKIKENLNLIARTLGDEFNYLNSVAQRLYKRFAWGSKIGIKIKMDDLLRQHVALQRLLVRHIIHTLKGDLTKITYRHWKEIETMLTSQKKSSVDLPGGVRAIRRQKYIIFMKKEIVGEYRPKLKKVIKLDVPGSVSIPELDIEARSEIVNNFPRFKKGEKGKDFEYVDGDSIASTLAVRTWRRGDRIKPLGMKSHKKLQDVFVDGKVARELRNEIPLITSKNRIVWVVGFKLSEDFKIHKNTKRVVRLTVKGLRKNHVIS